MGNIKGVLRVVGSPEEPQIVLGPGVADDVCTELKTMPGLNYSEVKADGALMKKKDAKGIFSFFAKVFAPLIPVFAGTGLIFGIMKLFVLIFNMTGISLFDPAAVVDGGSQFMAVLNVLASTFFTYLNIAVATVSYTHLDVYKRQILYYAVRVETLFLLWRFLLFPVMKNLN